MRLEKECGLPRDRRQLVEDRLLQWAQQDFLPEYIELYDERMTHEKFETIKDMTDYLVIADGGGPSSFSALPELGFRVEELGDADTALGVYYERTFENRDQIPWLQAMNVHLTLFNTIYLVNSFEARRGCLNIRVPPSYMDILNQHKEKTIDELDNSGHIVKQRIAQIIRAGLDMFDIPEETVKAINYITLPMRWVNPPVKAVEMGDKRLLAVVLGDAALKHHFWPGRGANSGLKGSVNLSWHFLHYLQDVKRKNTEIRVVDFSKYAGFMTELKLSNAVPSFLIYKDANIVCPARSTIDDVETSCSRNTMFLMSQIKLIGAIVVFYFERAEQTSAIVDSIASIVSLLPSASPMTQVKAAETLGLLAKSTSMAAMTLVRVGAVPRLVAIIRADGPLWAAEAAINALRALIASYSDAARLVANSGAIEYLGTLLSRDYLGVQAAAASALGDIAKLAGADTLISGESVVRLVSLMRTADTVDLKNRACNSLDAISAWSQEAANAVAVAKTKHSDGPREDCAEGKEESPEPYDFGCPGIGFPAAF